MSMRSTRVQRIGRFGRNSRFPKKKKKEKRIKSAVLSRRVGGRLLHTVFHGAELRRIHGDFGNGTWQPVPDSTDGTWKSIFVPTSLE